MLHGLNNQFLYVAFKIESSFTDKYSGKCLKVEGTGFFVNVNEKAAFVTNRHNLDAVYKDIKYVGYELSEVMIIGRISGENLLNLTLNLENSDIIYHNNAANDVAIILNPKFLAKNIDQIKIDNFISEDLIAGSSYFQTDLSVCDFLAFPGYPSWHDKIEQRPIFRSGTISSDPRKSYHFKSDPSDCGDCVAYEAFSSGGSSGSPVFALQKGIKPGPGIQFEAYRDAKLIGINGGHLNSADHGHSGISYFFKSYLILEMML